MFSVSPEIYTVLSDASRWLFAFFALMLLFFAFSWHHSARKERRERFKNLPGAGTIGELIVLSGSDELSRDTWFPVPREGVLGALRSCDLVIPCPGVSSQHLDFSWQDGTGLLIRPRAGCEVLVDGVQVSRRGGAYADTPMLHGSVLQVGHAVLRLQLFSALADTNRTFTQASPVSGPAPMVQAPPSPWQAAPPAAAQPWQAPAWPVQSAPVQPAPVQPMPPQPYAAPDLPVQPVPEQPEQTPAVQRRKRSDRWKEDWSE